MLFICYHLLPRDPGTVRARRVSGMTSTSILNTSVKVLQQDSKTPPDLVFPGEHPDAVELRQWLDASTGDVKQTARRPEIKRLPAAN